MDEMNLFMLVIGAVVGGSCGVLIFKVTKFLNGLESVTRRVAWLEKKIDSAQDQISRAAAAVSSVRFEFNNHAGSNEGDFHDLSKGLDAMEKRLDSLEEKLSDANEIMEAQARQEKLLFDGINSIMDYDVATARKAVNADGEG